MRYYFKGTETLCGKCSKCFSPVFARKEDLFSILVETCYCKSPTVKTNTYREYWFWAAIRFILVVILSFFDLNFAFMVGIISTVICWYYTMDKTLNNILYAKEIYIYDTIPLENTILYVGKVLI